MKRTVITIVLAALLAFSVTAQSSADAALLGEDLTSDRRNMLPNDTLQVVAFYDGKNDAVTALGIEVEIQNNGEPIIDWMWIDGLRPASDVIETREYSMAGAFPTGRFAMEGVSPNGTIDGVAFGLFLERRIRKLPLAEKQLERGDGTLSVRLAARDE